MRIHEQSEMHTNGELWLAILNPVRGQAWILFMTLLSLAAGKARLYAEVTSRKGPLPQGPVLSISFGFCDSALPYGSQSISTVVFVLRRSTRPVDARPRIMFRED